MFHLIRPGTNIDFVGKRKLWLGLSVVFLGTTIALFFTKGLNYGIDFTGGAEVQMSVTQSWDITRLRAELEDGGIKSPRVQRIGQPQDNEYLIRAQGDEKSLNALSNQIQEILQKNLKKEEFEIKRVDVVGPAAGDLLRKRGFLAMFYALLVILVYVAIRFDMRYAPGAVLALFHDCVLTVGVFILTEKQFDLTILAAILALIGYSNNDTIIVFDRVRETLHTNPNMKIEDAVNRSVNETLGRTIMTSLATFVVVFALWLFGGSVIENFAFTLLVGVIVGAYSSIFIASSFIIFLTQYQQKRQLKMKMGGGKKRKQYDVRPEPKFQA